MAKKFIADLDLSINDIENSELKEIHIGYQIDGKYQEYYHFKGYFTYYVLNLDTIAIIEIENEKKSIRPRVTIFMRKKKGHNIDTIPLYGKMPKISPEMNAIGKLIIPSPLDRVYSFELGGFVSASYSDITYDADMKVFLVKYIEPTTSRVVTLEGTLDTEGHLIDDTLYLPSLRTSYIVDEHNLESSAATLAPKIEKDFAKDAENKEQIARNEFEYQNYLARKRQKKS